MGRQGPLGILLEAGYDCGPCNCFWITSQIMIGLALRTAVNCECRPIRNWSRTKILLLIVMPSNLFQVLLWDVLFTHYCNSMSQSYVPIHMPEGSSLQELTSQRDFANCILFTHLGQTYSLQLSSIFLGCLSIFDNLSQTSTHILSPFLLASLSGDGELHTFPVGLTFGDVESTTLLTANQLTTSCFFNQLLGVTNFYSRSCPS